jgi:integrase
MARRRANGEGSIYRRKDGRWEAAVYLPTVSGKRKRVRVYGKTREEVHNKLTETKAEVQRGIPAVDQTWHLGEYLDYWLEQVVRANRRPGTYERYELAVRLYLKPGLGGYTLKRLSVPILQAYFNQFIDGKRSVRHVQILREVLSSALGRAQREELISRNVARLVELPTWERRKVVPWTVEEILRFLHVARNDPLYPAFVVLVLCGMRCGEVLGLRWCDVDFSEGVLHVRWQLRRVAGALRLGPLKTSASRRDLPLLDMVPAVLHAQKARQEKTRLTAEGNWKGDDEDGGLVFTTRSGRPIAPRNFSRSFQRICIRHGIRLIRLHDLRHTAATLYKDLGVPARDAQLILGHSDISITQQIYQHDSLDTRRTALGKVEKLLESAAVDVGSRRQQRALPSKLPQISRQSVSTVHNYNDFLSGRGDRDRTCDLRFWSSDHPSLSARLQSVSAYMERRTQHWLLGAVAVTTAVSDYGLLSEEAA